MSFAEDGSSDDMNRRAQKLDSFVFSCELSSKVPFFTFQGDEEEDLEHFLELRTVCLGEGAKEESNVVEVTALNHQGKSISVPIASLHINCLPMVCMGAFELKAPVTIRLKSGTGPVTVSGVHLVASEESEYGMSDDDDEDLEDSPIVPIKPAKKKHAACCPH